MEWRSWTELGGDLKAGATPSIAGTHRRELSLVARLKSGRVGLTGRSTAGWFGWTDQGLNCRDTPAMAVVAGRMVLAARGNDDALWIGGFQTWTSSAGRLTSAPSIAAWKMDPNAEIFARGDDATLQWFSFRNVGAAVQNPSPSTQRISGTPAAVAPGPNGIHVFARRESDSHLIHTVWNYHSWTAWADLGEVTTSSPSVVSRDIGALEVYFADTSGALARRKYTVGSGNQLVSAGQREVLCGSVLGDPAAATLGLWHVEVFHRQDDGQVVRIYTEGERASDDVAMELLDDQLVDSPPAAWALCVDTVVCAARNAQDQLVTRTCEDGYWGEWQNHGGFIDSDPVIVTRRPSTMEVFARDNNQHLVRWTRTLSTWSGPVVLPLTPTGWCQGQPRAFADWQGGVRIITRVYPNHLYEAVIGPNGAFQRWSNLRGAASTEQPEVIEVDRNALVAPYPSMQPHFGLEAGHWVVRPDTGGNLLAIKLTGGSWGPWKSFSTPGSTVRRPIPVINELGSGYAIDDSRIDRAKQTGWIGRDARGDIVQQRLVWVRRISYVAYITLDASPWTATPLPISLASDPTGVLYPERYDPAPSIPLLAVTHLFARGSQGQLRWTTLMQPTAAPLNWEWLATTVRLSSDVAPLVHWSSYENGHLLIAAAVTTGRNLLVGVGGMGPAQQRVQPTETVIEPVVPRFPLNPVRPVRPHPRPRPGPGP